MNRIETGKIVNTHGIKGEVKVVPWADSPSVFSRFKTIYIENIPYDVQSVRFQGDTVLMKLKGVTDMSAAEALKNKIIEAKREDFDLPKGTYFIEDLIGMTVFDNETGRELGTITDVFSTGANDVYEITDSTGEKYYIPAIRDCIRETDPEKKEMRIHIMEGLFDR